MFAYIPSFQQEPWLIMVTVCILKTVLTCLDSEILSSLACTDLPGMQGNSTQLSYMDCRDPTT